MILCFIADGRSIHTQRWAEYFAQRGYKVHLITYDPMGRNIEGVNEHVITSRWKNLYLSFIPRHIAIKKDQSGTSIALDTASLRIPDVFFNRSNSSGV